MQTQSLWIVADNAVAILFSGQKGLDDTGDAAVVGTRCSGGHVGLVSNQVIVLIVWYGTVLGRFRQMDADFGAQKTLCVGLFEFQIL